MDDTRQLRPVTTTDETLLVARAKTSREAFAPLYVLYFDRVYAYCMRRLGSPDEASDATSMIFARVLESLPQCRDTSFRSWLFAIAHNTLVDLHRSRRYDRPIDEIAEQVDRQPSPEDEAIRQESTRSVAVMLGLLPPDQRHVLELRLAGLTSREIGQVLGKSPNAVDQAQFRAVRRLRTLLSNSGPLVEGLR